MSSKFRFCLIILLFACFSQACIDIYLPSIPAIASGFKVPVYLAQWSIAIYLLGMTISLLFYGPISDAIGRKKPLLFGLFIAYCRYNNLFIFCKYRNVINRKVITRNRYWSLFFIVEISI